MEGFFKYSISKIGDASDVSSACCCIMESIEEKVENGLDTLDRIGRTGVLEERRSSLLQECQFLYKEFIICYMIIENIQRGKGRRYSKQERIHVAAYMLPHEFS